MDEMWTSIVLNTSFFCFSEFPRNPDNSYNVKSDEIWNYYYSNYIECIRKLNFLECKVTQTPECSKLQELITHCHTPDYPFLHKLFHEEFYYRNKTEEARLRRLKEEGRVDLYNLNDTGVEGTPGMRAELTSGPVEVTTEMTTLKMEVATGMVNLRADEAAVERTGAKASGPVEVGTKDPTEVTTLMGTNGPTVDKMKGTKISSTVEVTTEMAITDKIVETTQRSSTVEVTTKLAIERSTAKRIETSQKRTKSNEIPGTNEATEATKSTLKMNFNKETMEKAKRINGG